MENELPEVLYKYRDWNDEFHKRILTHNEIFFASGRAFNDPFDCQVLLRQDIGTHSQKMELVIRFLRAKYPNEDEMQRETRAERLVEELDLKDPRIMEDFKSNQQEIIFTQFGIFTLSSKRENILMWSHYSNSHKGFSVGFHGAQLAEFCKAMKRTGVYVYYHPVKYLSNYPLLNMLDDPWKKIHIIECVTTKSSDWQYEAEHRLIYLNGTNKAMEMQPDAYAEVILGCDISEEHKDEIKDVLNSKAGLIKLLQAKRKENEFGLEFEEVEY